MNAEGPPETVKTETVKTWEQIAADIAAALRAYDAEHAPTPIGYAVLDTDPFGYVRSRFDGVIDPECCFGPDGLTDAQAEAAAWGGTVVALVPVADGAQSP